MSDGSAALSSDAASVDVGTDADWQRLHPATLALSIVRLGPRTVNFLPALAAIGIAGKWIYVLPALGVFLLLSLAAAWFGWLRFRFHVGADQIAIESGIFARQHRTIPFDRIQDVSIEQGLIARALGIAKVGFETGAGGDTKDEARLDSIGLYAAQALRQTIRAHRGGAAPAAIAPAEGGATDAAEPVGEDRLLFAMTPQRLFVAGLFNFSLAALAVVGAAMQLFDNLLPFDFNIFNPVDWFDLAERYGLEQWVVAHRWVAGVGALVSLLFIGFASGVLMMMLANWGFRLTREPRALRRTRGLTTRTDVALPVRRVQAAILVTGWLRQRFGWHELRLQGLASDGEKEKDHQVVPFGRLAEIDPVLAEIGMARPPAEQPWQHSHRIVALGGFVGAGIAALGGAGTIAFGQPLGWIALAAALPIAAGAWISAHFHGWTEIGEMVAIRSGWLKPKTTLLPFASVQSADLSIDFILRRFGLATLVFGVPGGSSLGSHEIPAIPRDVAEALRTRILAARTRP
ncbi:PH domain-containing protein [Sphingopyxis panaciterrulae]|uniref:Putative membrane protein n=1 Tax=Sphingopyxis panaciterrulae TaxID=462372 RepID=A0A7W9B950_9SPHN|nr:PH domain-containing protein [Sphingopyxis panaciterrulae]MBB5708485.1 putative membrane protein [Sphingopyxis panaciterrulae]